MGGDGENRGAGYIDQRVTSHGQSGGITAHTVNNIGRQSLRFDAGTAEELFNSVLKGNKIYLRYIGAPEKFQIACDYANYLIARGISVEVLERTTMLVPPPSRQIEVASFMDRVTLTIAPDAG